MISCPHCLQAACQHLRTKSERTKGVVSQNPEFAQMQGAGKISQRRIWMICKQEIFPATQQLG
jgi:hypothetical protein